MNFEEEADLTCTGRESEHGSDQADSTADCEDFFRVGYWLVGFRRKLLDELKLVF